LLYFYNNIAKNNSVAVVATLASFNPF